ncbi:hypothetical protein [Terasakiella pusilla]|uniref:hypothetical protein n=1 Tax=Terasakiella pusilla TaxID=64973 RepID=UPI003AA95D2E
MTVLKIGTLSMERKTRYDNKAKEYVSDNLPAQSVRYDHIIHAITDHDLDILLCSGDFLDTSHMNKLLRYLKTNSCKTIVVADIDGRTTKLSPSKSSHWPFTRGQALYRIEAKEAKPVLLAKQTLVSSRELTSASKANGFASALISQLHHRNFTVKGKTVATMICGEINYFKLPKGGTVGIFDKAYQQIADHIADADIVLNPTHDRMGSNRGVLEAKREYLSRGIKGRNRCYVSASNWDINKLKQGSVDHFAQTRKAEGNHSVYVCGVNQKAHLKRVPVKDPKMLLSVIDVKL